MTLPLEVDREFQRFKEELRERFSDKEISLIEKAFLFASEKHNGQLRAEGSPYITHPLEVARILNQFNMDHITITAALLHDVLEDTPTSLDELEENFGREVARLVFGVTKITSISKLAEKSLREIPEDKGLSKREIQLRNLRRLLIVTVEDIRALILKLADRLHNMRTLKYLKPEKRRSKAIETLTIYVPLAHRLGMWVVKSELEDLSFQYAYPEEYELIKSEVERRLRNVNPILEEFKRELVEAINSHGIKSKITYRQKSLYSIFEKMQRKGLTLDQIYDILAFRVIVDTLEECYTILGIVHQKWMPLPNRIKDYIAKPKPNGYRSLHTTILYNSIPIEIQIRTHQMHQEAEWGIASHWKYKYSDSDQLDRALKAIMSKYSKSLANLIESIDEAIKAGSGELADLEEELNKSVFVFTPKGECLELPRGSTPIDFAYRIHTEVGHHCVGARVNGKLVPLTYELQNGDIVEIITSKTASPSLDWLSIAKTRLAKSKIKSYFKRKHKEEYVKRAREILEEQLRTKRIELTTSLDEALRKLYEEHFKASFAKYEDFLIAIGFGDIHPQRLIDKLRAFKLTSEESSSRRELPTGSTRDSLKVKGMLVKLARCCLPVKGDQIVGFITLGKGISIHRKDCKNLNAMLRNNPKLKDRLINLSWDDLDISTMNVKLRISALDRKGLLRDIMEVISGEGINVTSVRGQAKNGEAQITLTLEVSSSEHLSRIVNLILREIPEVRSVKRI